MNKYFKMKIEIKALNQSKSPQKINGWENEIKLGIKFHSKIWSIIIEVGKKQSTKQLII